MSPRLSIIGVSGYAHSVLGSLWPVLEESGARLTAATVINPDQVPETCERLRAHGTEIFGDYREMLSAQRGQIDLCLVPTSIHLHAPMCIAALQHGGHVLVEKPLAGSVAEGESIAAAAAAAGRFAAVGYQDMFAPTTLAAKELLLSGAIGPVRSVRLTGSWPRNVPYYTRNGWAGRLLVDGHPVYDSPINNAFAHFVNLALYFADPRMNSAATVVTVTGSLSRFYPIESFDTAAVRWVTGDGISIECILTHADPVQVHPRIVVQGESGQLIWKQGGEIQAFGANGRTLLETTPEDAEIKRQRVLRTVIECAAIGRTPLCDAAFAQAHVRATAILHEALAIADRGPQPSPAATEWPTDPDLFQSLLARPVG